MSDQRIDDAIDRAVREIMHADPGADFRRRVLLRIEQPARTAWVWGPGFAAAAALTIVIVLAFLVARRSPTPVPQGETVSNRPAVSVPGTSDFSARTEPQSAHAVGVVSIRPEASVTTPSIALDEVITSPAAGVR